jgi:hypothetical protein
MTCAIIRSNPEWGAADEPLYDIDPRTGDTVEIFYADGALAKSFGTRSGWFWWSCQRGSLPDRAPTGPFQTSYAAYRDTPGSPKTVAQFGKRRHSGGMDCS